MNTKKSKKTITYIESQMKLIPGLINNLNILQDDLRLACIDRDEDKIQGVSRLINQYESMIQQIIALDADEVYVNVYVKNDVYRYKVIEMITPSKWVIDYNGEQKPIFRGNKTGYFTCDKHVAVPTAQPTNI